MSPASFEWNEHYSENKPTEDVAEAERLHEAIANQGALLEQLPTSLDTVLEAAPAVSPPGDTPPLWLDASFTPS